MDRNRIEIPVGNKPKKKKLFKSLVFRPLLNAIGRLKKFITCFGCGDSLWWKKEVGMAYTEHAENDYPFVNSNPETRDKIRKMKPGETLFLGVRRGTSICRQCFINKPEEKLLEIFETVAKPLWMKGQKLEQIEKIKNYSLYLPIRTTGGIFKKEMVEIPQKNSLPSLVMRFLRKYSRRAGRQHYPSFYIPKSEM